MSRRWTGTVQPVMLLAFALGGAALGAEAPQGITSRMTAASPASSPLDPAWLKLPPTTIGLYPQAGVSTTAATSRRMKLRLRAMHDGKTLALHLEWNDARPARVHGIGAFADAVAVQWPLRYGAGDPLPYVGMGHAGNPVAIWFWRADGRTETLAAEGFSTLSAQGPDGFLAEGLWRDGRWRVVFRRAFAIERGALHPRIAPHTPIPLALAVWDGGANERDGAKRLSAWHALRFEGGGDDQAERPVASKPVGDPDNGKRLMITKGCAACHAFPGNPARPSIGPDLTYAGGVHSSAYLYDSLTAPSNVVVPGRGFSAMIDGKRVSIMPPFAGSDRERSDIVTYLRSLK